MGFTVEWVQLRGYSIESQLKAEGLSFDAFDIVGRTFGDSGVRKLRTKIIGRLGSELRREYSEAMGEKEGVDIGKIYKGCYCIALGGEYQMAYQNGSASRIVYIGSGSILGRLKSHLSGKLFDFAQSLRSVPLRFYISDLGNGDNDPRLDRQLEQCLLSKFAEMYDPAFPLLNKNRAALSEQFNPFSKGWDLPVQKDKGPNVANWLIQPRDAGKWKGAL